MDESLRLFRALMQRAESLGDQNFRMLLEEALARGGREAELAFAKLLMDGSLPFPTRMNMVRVCGYVQTPGFLGCLKQIVDRELHVHLRKEAIIAVAKYNDKRALAILNGALAGLPAGPLHGTLVAEIHRIKQNNPLLAMMPRFREGSGNPRAFAITVEVLKRITTADDAPEFISFLESDDPLVGPAAFEILCACGGDDLQAALLSHFRIRIQGLEWRGVAACDPLYRMLLALETYARRHPRHVDGWLEDLRAVVETSGDRRVRELVLNVLGLAGSAPALEFLLARYDDPGEMRAPCREALARHPAGVERLAERLRSQPPDRLDIVATLLANETGCRLLAESRADDDPEVRDFLLQRLDEGNYRHFSGLLRRALGSGEPGPTKLALGQLRQNLDFSLGAELPDANAGDRFAHCREDHFETLARLFPAQAFSQLLGQLGQLQLPATVLLRRLRLFSPWLEADPVVTACAGFRQAFATMARLRNRDINRALLGTLQHLKTFHLPTLAEWQETFKEFAAALQAGGGLDETGALHKARNGLRDLAAELAPVGEGLRQVEHWLQRQDVSPGILDSLCKSHSQAVFLRRRAIREKLAAALDAGTDPQVPPLLARHPLLALPLRDRLAALPAGSRLSVACDIAAVVAAIPEAPRFVLRFRDPAPLPALRGQLQELLPEIPLDEAGEASPAGAFLVADSGALKALLAEGRQPAWRVFAVLDDLADFAHIRSCQPVTMPAPLNLARLCRHLVRELFG